MDDHHLAAGIARRAGELLLRIRAELSGADPARLRKEGDCRSNDLILGLLRQARPGDAVLSEEAADDLTRLAAERVWIVDPLDGTREFAEPDRTDWAVHVALWEKGDLVAGAVALPALGEVHSTAAPGGSGPPSGPIRRIAVSRTRPPAFVAGLCQTLGAEAVPLGSAGAKVMAVLRGTVDAYVHAGGQYEWDSAAPVAVARAAGLYASRLDGSPLRYNAADPCLPDLVICREDVATVLLTACGAEAD